MNSCGSEPQGYRVDGSRMEEARIVTILHVCVKEFRVKGPMSSRVAAMECIFRNSYAGRCWGPRSPCRCSSRGYAGRCWRPRSPCTCSSCGYAPAAARVTAHVKRAAGCAHCGHLGVLPPGSALDVCGVKLGRRNTKTFRRGGAMICPTKQRVPLGTRCTAHCQFLHVFPE